MYVLYFDPGLGAMLVQAAVAATAGFLMFSKGLLYKIKLFFGLEEKADNDLFDDISVDETSAETEEK